MPTRQYARAGGSTGTCNAAQLSEDIDAKLGRNGHHADVDPTLIRVSHPQLVAGDDPLINQAINDYVFDPLFGVSVDVRGLRDQVQVLRQWSADAQAIFDSWSTFTQQQKDDRLKELFRRIGITWDKLATLITKTVTQSV